jgi:hypothetical protein
MREKGYKRIARLTDAGTSATVASKSQLRPLRSKNNVSRFRSSEKESPPPHLLPEDVSEIKCTNCFDAQTEYTT